MRAIFAAYRDGSSLAGIAPWLVDANAPRSPAMRLTGRWEPNGLRGLLANVTYTGTQVVDGEQHLNAHPVLIDDALWRSVRERTTHEQDGDGPRRRQGRWSAVDTFLRDGRLRCLCGAHMTVQLDHPGHQHASRLRCPRSLLRARGLPCDAIRRSVTLIAAEHVVRQCLVDDLRAVRPWSTVAPAVRRLLDADQPDRTLRRRRLERERADVAERQGRLIDLHVSGRVGLDQYDGLAAPLIARQSAIDAELAALPSSDAELVAVRTVAAVALDSRLNVSIASTDKMVALMTQLGATAWLDLCAPEGIWVDYALAFTVLLAASKAPTGASVVSSAT